MTRSAAPGALVAWPLDAVGIRALRRRLLSWFRRHRRDLPWRRTDDPYRIWLSEVMLQQTQVATVIGYFERFVAALPTIESLAAADEQHVLRLWEGLGYYRRARQLHAAARRIVAEHGGRMPSQRQALESLPGFGRYTAAAVASIAFDRPEAIVEANTARLLARLAGQRGEITAAPVRGELWRIAELLVPGRGAGQFNQGLMELGALVCTPSRPACAVCPLAPFCVARQTGRPESFGRPGKRQATESVREAYVVVWRGRKLLARQNGEGQRWAGLWDFPRVAVPDDVRGSAPRLGRHLTAAVREQTGVTAAGFEHLLTLRHGVTRFSITLDCYASRFVDEPGRGGSSRQQAWIAPAALAELPLSVTGRKLARRILGSTAAVH